MWQTLWIRSELAATGVEETILHPFRLDEVDIAPQEKISRVLEQDASVHYAGLGFN